MSTLLYIFSYLAVIVFAAAVASKISNYLKKPLHVRWELYPVAHEPGRAAYGGSYLEDVDWWQKPRHKSRLGELKVMVPEILLLKAVWEHNRKLWWRTYPFHLGLYLTAAFIGLLFLGAILSFGDPNLSAGLGVPVAALTNLLGPLAMILTIFGACSLFYKRLTDESLRQYSSLGHFVNLGIFIAAMGVAFITWLTTDPNFVLARELARNLITLHFAPVGNGLFGLQVFLAFFTLAYIPLTHMSHFFMKYFLYHDIRWGDEPNINTPKTDAKIGTVLGYKVSWAASHIDGKGQKTWAEVATHNPMAEDAGKQAEN
ncbi:MAG: nitrate reductase [Thermodesulfobacteriota bacterium]